MTQVYWVCEPFSVPMIRGSALDTTVELIRAMNIANRSPLSDFSTCWRGITSATAFPSAMPFPSWRCPWHDYCPAGKIAQQEAIMTG